jgi:hypothetical protein
MSSSTTRCAYCHPPLLLLLLLLTNIHACRPANTLLVRPLCPLLFFLDTLQQTSLGPDSYPTNASLTTPSFSYRLVSPPHTLPQYSSHVPAAWTRPRVLRTHRLTNYLYPRPLSRTKTLSKSKSHAANRRRHRQSDIANPARPPSHTESNTPLPTSSLRRRLSHPYPYHQPLQTRIRTSTLPALPSSAVYSGLRSMEFAILRKST